MSAVLYVDNPTCGIDDVKVAGASQAHAPRAGGAPGRRGRVQVGAGGGGAQEGRPARLQRVHCKQSMRKYVQLPMKQLPFSHHAFRNASDMRETLIDPSKAVYQTLEPRSNPLGVPKGPINLALKHVKT